MAIALDTTTAYGSSSGTTRTFSHTCTGSNLILFVTANVHTATATVTGVTYNGVAMTSVGSQANTSATTTLWYLLSPATGANNVVITANNSDTIESASASYTGVKQSGQPDASSVGGPTTTTNYTQSVTSVADNCVAIFAGISNNGGAVTAGTNTTLIEYNNTAYGGLFMRSTAAKTPAGTFTLAASSVSSAYSGVMASISPFVASSVNSNFLMFM